MNALAIHLYLTIRYINLTFNYFDNYYRIIDYPNPIVKEAITLRDIVYLYKDSNKNDTEEYS